MYFSARATIRNMPPSNVVPFWLFCYWRLVLNEAEGDFAKAWKMLPAYLPDGMKCPTVAAMAATLVVHGLSERHW